MKSLKGLLLALGLIMLAMPSSVHGQAATASASADGTVTDTSGATVSGAEVSITNDATHETRKATTGSSGDYRFDFLVPGSYTVKVTKEGFKTGTANSVVLFVSHTTTVNMALEVGSTSQTVVVSAEAAPLADVQSTSIGAEITEEQIQDIPMNGRDVGNLALLAPGTEPAQNYDATKKHYTVYTVNDSGGRNVNATVNGIDDKDNTVGGTVMQLPLSAIEEFSISTERFSAANGRSEGAAVNVVTKSGTNQWHGGGYIFGTDTALNANNYFSKVADQPTPEYTREQFGGDFGGAIRKDKDWFFGAIERDREQTQLPENPFAYQQLTLLTPYGADPAEVIPTPYFDTRYNFRIDHKFSSRNTAFISYTGQSNNGLNDQSSGFEDLSASNFTTNHLILANVSLNTVISPTTVNVVTIGYQYWNNVIGTDNPSNKVLSFSGGALAGISFGAPSGTPQESIEKKWQFKDDVSLTRGANNISFGADFVWEPELGGILGKGPDGNLTISFGATPQTIVDNTNGLYPEGLATPGAVVSMTQSEGDPYFFVQGGAKAIGTYFQDNWQVRKGLTLNLGGRWDKDIGLYGSQTGDLNRAYLILKAIGSPYAAALPHNDSKDFSPRIGFAWDIHGNGRQVLRGGYGTYFDQLFLNINLGYLEQSNPLLYATVTNISWPGPGNPASTCPASPASACTVPGTGILLSNWRYGIDPLPTVPPPLTNLISGSSGTIMSSNYRNPYSEEANLGYTFVINDTSVFTADYIHELGLHESRNVPINPKEPSLNETRLLTAAFEAANEPVLGAIGELQSIGRSRYDALELVYKRRMNHRVSINAAYTLSRGVGWDGLAASFSTPDGDDEFVDPNNLWNKHNDFGPSPNDERNHVSISSIIAAPWGIEIAPILIYGGARPYTCRAGQDVLGEGSTAAAECVVPVNDPTEYQSAFATETTTQQRACLAAGTCEFSGFGTLRGDPFFDLDLRVTKTFTFREKYKLDLIAQMFNLTNRANFGNDYINNPLDGAAFRTPSGFLGELGPSSNFPVAFRAEFGAQFHF